MLLATQAGTKAGIFLDWRNCRETMIEIEWAGIGEEYISRTRTQCLKLVVTSDLLF
jgi:hypothetical protein